MTPFSSVAMLEKLALLRIAFCKAPAFNRTSLRWPGLALVAATAAEFAAARDVLEVTILGDDSGAAIGIPQVPGAVKDADDTLRFGHGEVSPRPPGQIARVAA
jgi:hypothetical protein